MSHVVEHGASDPSVAGTEVAWQRLGREGVVDRGQGPEPQLGTHPALGGQRLALRADGLVRVLDRAAGQEQLAVGDPGAGALAVSDAWLVIRAWDGEGDRLDAVSLADGTRRTVAQASAPRELGRPAVHGDLLVFHEVVGSGSRLREVDLRTGAARTMREAGGALLLNPSLQGDRLLYVQSTSERQRLRLGDRRGDRRGRYDRTLYDIAPTARRDAGHEPGRGRHRAGYRRRRPPRLPERAAPGVVRTLWTTALGDSHAYVTRLAHRSDGVTEAMLLRVGLG